MDFDPFVADIAFPVEVITIGCSSQEFRSVIVISFWMISSIHGPHE